MVFVKLYLLFLCINAGIGIMLFVNPGLAPAFEVQTAPNFYNGTNPNDPDSASYNSTHVTNSSGNGNPLSFIFDAGQYLLYVGKIAIDFITLGFIFSVFAALGNALGIAWPDELMIGLYAIFGFIFFLWLIKMIFGRDSGSLTS